MASSFLTSIARQEVGDFNDAAEQQNKRANMWNNSTIKGSNGKAMVYQAGFGDKVPKTNDTDATGQYRVSDPVPGARERMAQVTGANGQPLLVAQGQINGKFIDKPNAFKMKDPSENLTVEQMNEITNPQSQVEEEPGLIARMLKK